MKAQLRALALTLLLFFCHAQIAWAEKLTVAFSSDHIAIGSDFTGAELTVFGGIERGAEDPKRTGPYDAIMIVRGPQGSVTVREKRPAGPFWLNGAQHRFQSVPSFLLILSDRPVEEIIDRRGQAQLPASVEAQFAAHEATVEPESGSFAAALIRIRRAQGLFGDDSDAITFLSSTLFRTTVRLPGAAPLGHYDVEVMAFADGEEIATNETGFWVNRSGFEHILAVAARRHGLLYGLAVIAMALSFGWIASVIFRRD
jgi:uncharacterized protein (TIGR02186 family)